MLVKMEQMEAYAAAAKKNGYSEQVVSNIRAEFKETAGQVVDDAPVVLYHCTVCNSRDRYAVPSKHIGNSHKQLKGRGPYSQYFQECRIGDCPFKNKSKKGKLKLSASDV